MSTEREISCVACDGEGRVEHPHMPMHGLHSESPEYAIVDCGECQGTGKVWADEVGPQITTPWEVRKTATAYDVCLPVAPNDTGIAVVATVFGGEEQALLIAAAPDLLIALQGLMDATSDYTTEVGSEEGAIFGTAYERARRAYAKAARAEQVQA